MQATPSYMTLTDMWLKSGQWIMEAGTHVNSRAGATVEVMNYSATLIDINNNFLLSKVRKADPAYGAAELLWYLSSSDDVKMMETYAPQYRRFAEPNSDECYGAYGPRIWKNFRIVIELLRKHPETRQAYLPIWNAHDPMKTHLVNDMPCTLGLNFHVRSNRLYCTAHMRSNDFWLGMPYDVFCFTMIQRMVADALGLGYGTYHHIADSFHIYLHDSRKVDDAIREWPQHTLDVQHNWSQGAFTFDSIQRAVKLERELRENKQLEIALDWLGPAEDLLCCCYGKLRNVDKLVVNSDILNKAWEMKYANH